MISSNRSNHSSLESKTRRWGRLNHRNNNNNDKTTVTNQFGPMAPCFVYWLLSKFSTSKHNKNIWGGPNGVHLLAQFIFTLSTLVQSSGLYPGTSVLALELYHFVYSFHKALDAELRRAVLIGLAVCLPLLPETALSEVVMYAQHKNGLWNFLEETQHHDADGQCRHLAKILFSSISNAVGVLNNGGRGRVGAMI